MPLFSILQIEKNSKSPPIIIMVTTEVISNIRIGNVM
uniref:Uncharacterized protein n=1 Tax=Anguilla anguilla TaxID=7936 RepID=A0A0E9U4S1_ANGAN